MHGRESAIPVFDTADTNYMYSHPQIQYVDDCTYVYNYESVSILQQSANIVRELSVRNDPNINSTKPNFERNVNMLF